jgi:hypothetical protein
VNPAVGVRSMGSREEEMLDFVQVSRTGLGERLKVSPNAIAVPWSR